MGVSMLRCPRCLAVIRDESAKFCPHCGLADLRAATRSETVELTAAGRTYRVGEVLAYGDVCNLYHCDFATDEGRRTGVFKIARAAAGNPYLRSSAQILQRLHSGDVSGRYAPFLPSAEATIVHGPPQEQRVAQVLAYHPDVESPLEFYSLAEVRRHYTAGVDPRDMAWIWRRLLSVLGHVHSLHVAHNALIPDHVLIEPAMHKLVLVGWGGATSQGASPLPIIPGTYREWYSRHAAASMSADIRLAVRTMFDLLGADPLADTAPASLDPGLQRYFDRCLNSTSVDAWKLLHDFDKLIEAMWGPRTFRPFTMPPRN